MTALARQATAPRPAGRNLDLRGITILIVEDHRDSAEMLQQVVTSFGATAILARDGREAIAALGRQVPDLILSDLLMPRMSGFELMDWLRGNPELCRIPVIALTALGAEGDIMRTWSAGFQGHLVKPVDCETIAAQLERAFGAPPQAPPSH